MGEMLHRRKGKNRDTSLITLSLWLGLLQPSAVFLFWFFNNNDTLVFLVLTKLLVQVCEYSKAHAFGVSWVVNEWIFWFFMLHKSLTKSTYEIYDFLLILLN